MKNLSEILKANDEPSAMYSKLKNGFIVDREAWETLDSIRPDETPFDDHTLEYLIAISHAWGDNPVTDDVAHLAISGSMSKFGEYLERFPQKVVDDLQDLYLMTEKELKKELPKDQIGSGRSGHHMRNAMAYLNMEFQLYMAKNPKETDSKVKEAQNSCLADMARYDLANPEGLQAAYEAGIACREDNNDHLDKSTGLYLVLAMNYGHDSPQVNAVLDNTNYSKRTQAVASLLKPDELKELQKAAMDSLSKHQRAAEDMYHAYVDVANLVNPSLS